MCRDIVEEKQVGYLTVRVMRDEMCPSPRENDNLGDMHLFHKRYDFENVDNLSNSDALRLCNSAQQISLPVFLYDHSGIALSTESFIGRAQHASWDSGMIGWITVSKEKIRQEFDWKVIGKVRLQKVYRWLDAEVREYNEWLQGNCYCYETFNAEGDGVDSMSGYVGDGGIAEALADGVCHAEQIIFNEEHKEEVKPNVN